MITSKDANITKCLSCTISKSKKSIVTNLNGAYRKQRHGNHHQLKDRTFLRSYGSAKNRCCRGRPSLITPLCSYMMAPLRVHLFLRFRPFFNQKVTASPVCSGIFCVLLAGWESYSRESSQLPNGRLGVIYDSQLHSYALLV
jgi:hypothetical protein